MNKNNSTLLPSGIRLVAIDLDGTVVGWRNPPDESSRPRIEKAIREAFDIPEPITNEETDDQ